MTHTKDEALRMALEALETELFIDWTNNDEFNASAEKMQEAITAIKKALAAPVQEPVAWRTYTGRGYYIIDLTFEEAQKNWPDRQHQPLYTTPPAAQRQWVGLRDDEIFSVLDKLQAIYNGPPTGDSRVIFALAIEAKLKEKNT